MPTIRRCCIVGCLSNSRQNPQLQFFQFPKPENPFHKIWKHACYASLARILPFKKPVVCALHFHPNCVGGRRLTASAVPSLRLEVPSNLKAVEQQAMVEEIERSRKCAYINAVVYEWLVRANLNPSLRGSITHGMIKEKADTAKQIIGSVNFVADNRWLNRFRETHLQGFAQKLASNQLKPLGPSLWIPDIVQDLQHLFPPTSADRVANLENVPEQYIDYMQQYGEYDEDDEDEKKDMSSYYHDRLSQSNSYSNSPQNVSAYNSPPQPPISPQNNSQDYPYAKRPKLEETDDMPASNGSEAQNEDKSDDEPTENGEHEENGENGGTTTPPADNGKTNGSSSSTSQGSPASLHQDITNGKTNGHASPANANTDADADGDGDADVDATEIDSYTQALTHLKPLEAFALSRENFRAIGLISQLEIVLRKCGNRTSSHPTSESKWNQSNLTSASKWNQSIEPASNAPSNTNMRCDDSFTNSFN